MGAVSVWRLYTPHLPQAPMTDEGYKVSPCLKIRSTLWYNLCSRAPCGTTPKPPEPHPCLTFFSALSCFLCFLSPEYAPSINHFFKNPHLRLCFLGTQTKTRPLPLATTYVSRHTWPVRTLRLFGRCTHVKIFKEAESQSLDPE